MFKIKIKTHAASSKEAIVEVEENFYEIWIKEKPVDNKANMKIEKMMKKYFGKPVRMKSGFTSKVKMLEVGE